MEPFSFKPPWWIFIYLHIGTLGLKPRASHFRQALSHPATPPPSIGIWSQTVSKSQISLSPCHLLCLDLPLAFQEKLFECLVTFSSFRVTHPLLSTPLTTKKPELRQQSGGQWRWLCLETASADLKPLQVEMLLLTAVFPTLPKCGSRHCFVTVLYSGHSYQPLFIPILVSSALNNRSFIWDFEKNISPCDPNCPLSEILPSESAEFWDYRWTLLYQLMDLLFVT